MADDERRASARSIVIRAIVIAVALALSAFVLVNAFDDLDPSEILDSLQSLEDAELIALAGMWILWIASQGLQTSSLIEGLPVRRGVVAFLGPAAIASMIPGPSDLPVRYRMLTSWGRDRADATLAVGAGGLFSIGIKLVLPVIAAIGLILSDSPIEGTLRTIVVIALIVGLVLVVVAFVFSSPRRTERVGRLLDPVWRFGLRLLRKPERDDLGVRLVAVRERAVATLRDRWPVATWGTILTAAARYALLLLALRFTGVPEDALTWTEVFIVFALVQGLTVVPITAGDAGVSEVAYIGLLTAAAGSEYVNAISAAVILFRVLTWLLIIPIGLFVIGAWSRSVGKQGAAASG
jgi:hypothetical protein